MERQTRFKESCKAGGRKMKAEGEDNNNNEKKRKRLYTSGWQGR